MNKIFYSEQELLDWTKTATLVDYNFHCDKDGNENGYDIFESEGLFWMVETHNSYNGSKYSHDFGNKNKFTVRKVNKIVVITESWVFPDGEPIY